MIDELSPFDYSTIILTVYLSSSLFFISFIVDTILLFFRAYYNEDGVIVYELRRIARNYVFSGRFFFHLLASAPLQVRTYIYVTTLTQTCLSYSVCSFYFQFVIYMLDKKYEIHEDIEDKDLNLLVLTALLRLLKIPAIRNLLQSSIAFQNFWEKQNVARSLFLTYIFQLILISHWVACLWSFIAFIQVKTFGTALGEEANWISNWYEESYVAGGINPLGWENDIGRYALSLLWAIQSITSIGYGNIVPVTRVEYYFANLLMLGTGLFWAFTIGNIVSIVHHMNSNNQQYIRSLDKANHLIHSFSPPAVEVEDGDAFRAGHKDRVATRIRKFVRSQYDYKMVLNRYGNSPNLEQVYPTLQGLSEELRQLASLQLMQRYLEMIPYLSSKYLSAHEQSTLAFKCRYVEFARGELYAKHPNYGRGIMIPLRGMALNMGTVGAHGSSFRRGTLQTFGIGDPFGVDDVLVEDSFFDNELPLYRFSSYALCSFIPQSAIYDAMETNKSAWKRCGRWAYLRGCLLKLARCKDASMIPKESAL